MTAPLHDDRAGSRDEGAGPAVRALVAPDVVGPRLAAATGDDAWRAFDATLIAGGKSNLTFVLRSTAGELVLRRPPTGELLPSAHDMRREARIQRALDGNGVPVARIVLVDEDGDDLGVPYYVMEKVDGHVVRDELPEGYGRTVEDKRAMADALVDGLVAMHGVDVDAVGLGDLGRREGYLERQIRRWLGQSERASASVACEDLPVLAARLGETMPGSPPACLTHGDYRLDNCVLDPSDPGRILAVLDWELSTLGDPLADLGISVLYWGSSEWPALPLVPDITRGPGWPGPRHLAERYCAATGADDALLPWYLAFSSFKFAAIAQGVATRAEAGDMAGQTFGDVGGAVRELVAHGLRTLETGEAFP